MRKYAKRRRKYSDDIVRKARELYEQGVPMPHISRMLDVNYSTMWDWLKRGRRRDAV
jgi:transposase-like protein